MVAGCRHSVYLDASAIVKLVIDEPESVVPTDMPEMLPVETMPVELMLPIVVFDITPEPALPSSGARNAPPKVPMLTLLVVP